VDEIHAWHEPDIIDYVPRGIIDHRFQAGYPADDQEINIMRRYKSYPVKLN
jgi:hypothetical protein